MMSGLTPMLNLVHPWRLDLGVQKSTNVEFRTPLESQKSQAAHYLGLEKSRLAPKLPKNVDFRRHSPKNAIKRRVAREKRSWYCYWPMLDIKKI